MKLFFRLMSLYWCSYPAISRRYAYIDSKKNTRRKLCAKISLLIQRGKRQLLMAQESSILTETDQSTAACTCQIICAEMGRINNQAESVPWLASKTWSLQKILATSNTNGARFFHSWLYQDAAESCDYDVYSSILP